MDSFTKLIQIIDTLKEKCPNLSEESIKNLKQCVHEMNYYFKSYFKYEISRDSHCKDHCLVYSLSDNKDPHFAETCTHDHSVDCYHCVNLRKLIGTIAWIIDANQDTLGEADFDSQNYDLKKCYQRILAYKIHCLKAICQSSNWENMVDKNSKENVFVILGENSSAFSWSSFPLIL